MRIGARHDRKGIVIAAVNGRLDAIDHFGGLDQRFSRPMTAALYADLIFDMTTGGAGFGHLANGPADHERTAPPRIGIDQQGHFRCGADAPDVFADVAQRRHCQVGQTAGRVCHPGTGQVDRPKSGIFGQQGHVGINRADDLQGPLDLQGVAESCSCTHNSPQISHLSPDF